MSDRLYRSPTDRVIAGVAGGLAEWMHVDPSIVRVAWVVLTVLSGGILLLVYLVMMIVVPLPPAGWMPGYRPGGYAGGAPAPGAVPGWQAPAAGGWQTPPPSDPGWQAPPVGADAETQAQPTAPGTEGAYVPPAATGWQPGWQSRIGPNRGNGNAGIVVGGVLVAIGAWFLVRRYVYIDWDSSGPSWSSRWASCSS